MFCILFVWTSWTLRWGGGRGEGGGGGGEGGWGGGEGATNCTMNTNLKD